MKVTEANLSDKIKDAFRKLQAYYFFENTDLYVRSQLVSFINGGGIDRLEAIANDIKSNPKKFDPHFSKIGLRYYPKEVEIENSLQKSAPPNFISNVFAKSGSVTKRLGIFCDLPIELHLVAILWIREYGYILDRRLTKNAYGNRLLLISKKVGEGRTLFKPYVKQYQKFWAKGIDVADKLLKQGEDVTVITFDLKDYFHRAEIDFELIERELSQRLGDISNDNLHKLFKRIHSVYAKQLMNIRHPAYEKQNENIYPLPIGVLSSFVLANWHLKRIDAAIKTEIIPSYYGRYVDDFFIVLKNRIVKKFPKTRRDELNAYLNKFKLSVTSDKKLNLLNYFLYRYFSKILEPISSNESDETGYKIKLKGLSNLHLQNNKIFVYQFDSEMSPTLVAKFVEDQKKRSSEFRFLSDQEDESFEDFELDVFESNFDSEDVNKVKFKNLEEDKFKLSVYFAKLIQRKIERGKGYKENEIEKIEKYFKGYYGLKFYFFWEKIITLFLVSDNKKLFSNFIRSIVIQIKNLKIETGLAIDSSNVRSDLMGHLKASVQMATGLNPGFLDQPLKSLLEKLFGETEFDTNFFRKSVFLRKQFICYPLLQLSKKSRESDFSLIDQDVFNQVVWVGEDMEILEKEFLPFRVKFYEVSLFIYSKNLFGIEPDKAKELKKSPFDLDKNLTESFDLFHEINNPGATRKKEDVRAEYFGIDHLEKNPVRLNEIYLKNGGIGKDKYTVGIFNKYIDLKDFTASLEGKPNLSPERVETYAWALDQLSQIKGLDLFAMPELSLPYAFVKRYVAFSVRQQIAFISGIEHINAASFGYNLLLVCLPINIKGDRDAIPILRLKNHYAPEEEELIESKRMGVPKPMPYRYDLCIWRGLYFSTYYCFELANILHRTVFYSKVDLLCAPVWNPDTHYYSNIVEATTRDLHCYFMQVNTSQYGDSRVSRPTNHIRKDKVRVKGGTIESYKVNILVSEIDVKGLREFQKLSYSGQKKKNAGKKSFKPTPPDFPVENVIVREKNKKFSEGKLPF